jgi:alpha-galactosidase
MERRRIAIGYIGGGSRNWALKLMSDLALEPSLEGELRLYDIDAQGAKHNESLGKALFSKAEAAGRFEARAVETAIDALEGADFVVMSIEPGPMAAREADLLIPARYGIVQTVGDTVGPGGLVRALRAIPTMIEYGRLIMEHCPDAWVINYTNPMTLCVAALHDGGPGIKAYGCCHEVFGTQERIASIIAEKKGCAAPPRKSIELDIAGVNHFTFAAGARHGSEDLMPMLRAYADTLDPELDRTAKALERRASERWFDSDGAIAFDFLRRFGALGAAGDRHLAEFVPWYLVDEATILSKGVPPTPYAWRARVWSEPRPSADAVRSRPIDASGEEGVAQMKALLGMGPLKTNINIPNGGQWPQAPIGAVVECNALLEEGSVKALLAPDLPPAIASLERRIIDEQAIALEAAKARDPALALEALLLDPLVHMPAARAESMLREMLDAASPWLPGWKID